MAAFWTPLPLGTSFHPLPSTIYFTFCMTPSVLPSCILIFYSPLRPPHPLPFPISNLSVLSFPPAQCVRHRIHSSATSPVEAPCRTNEEVLDRTGWSRGNALDFIRYHWVRISAETPIQTEGFRVFPQSLQENFWIVNRLGSDFLPNPFQFNPQSSCYSTLYNINSAGK
jgi:hypothetical protein